MLCSYDFVFIQIKVKKKYFDKDWNKTDEWNPDTSDRFITGPLKYVE